MSTWFNHAILPYINSPPTLSLSLGDLYLFLSLDLKYAYKFYSVIPTDSTLVRIRTKIRNVYIVLTIALL